MRNPLTALVRSWKTALATVIAVVIAIGVVLSLTPPDRVLPEVPSGLPASYQSAEAELRAAALPTSDTAPAIVVVSRTDNAPLDRADRAAITERAEALAPLAAGGPVAPPQHSQDNTVAVVAVPVDTSASATDVIAEVGEIRATAGQDLPAGLAAQVTGGPAITADLGKVFEGADVTLLLATVLVVALLLIITYRSPWFWLVPLAVVALGEQFALKLVALTAPAFGLAVDESATGITSVLVFGAATDYALLLISRYRSQLRTEPSRFTAMQVAVRRTTEPIVASAATVVLSLLTLLLADQQLLRGLGYSAAVGVVVAMVFALVLLPASLVLFGRGLFWPFVPRVGDVAREGRFWGRIGTAVSIRPALTTVLSSALLLVLALGATGISLGLSQADQFREKPEAIAAQETLARAFPAGAATPATIVTTPDQVAAVTAAAQKVPGVATVQPGPAGDDAAQVNVILTDAPGSPGSDQAIADLRSAVAGVPDANAVVGGDVARQIDVEQAAERDARVIIPLVLAIVFVVLVVLLRALVAPVLLVITVVATFFASLGASWWILSNILGYPGLDSGVLLLSFLFLVALGVDYNIFLVTRAREESMSLGTKAGMLAGLRATGGVITSAGILLAAVFAVLGVLPLVALAQIGLIVCIGVLLDTLLVRTVLVPALAFLTGGRFWWPARLAADDADRREEVPVAG
ncbi:MAG: MMPL family transporter [Candidatus Nanopelagicales bacterium]